jgi:hypothetical protein
MKRGHVLEERRSIQRAEFVREWAHGSYAPFG